MTTKITITEALAEIPTIEKRIEKKKEVILSYLYRQSSVRDPHEKDGGSNVLIAREKQAIADLQERLITIRAVIQRANSEHTITIGNQTRTIVDWLTWRREIAPTEQRFLHDLMSKINEMRQKAIKQGVSITEKDAGFSSDYVVNINERELAEKIEGLENILGTLDGQLSLKNATIMVEL
jgi:hypothetical protein